MQIGFADCKQELTLFLLELIRKIDVSKFPADDSDSLNRYICVSLRNKCIALSKQNQNEFKHRIQFEDEVEEVSVLEHALLKLDIQKDIEFEQIISVELEEALNGLSTKQKDVIVYKYIYGFSDAEIGEIFNISRQAINRLKNRAFETLKEYYKEGANNEQNNGTENNNSTC